MIALALMASVALTFTGQAAPSPSRNDGSEKRICRQDPSTGTILPKRICHTKAEWNAIRAHDTVDTDNAFDRRGNNRLPDVTK